MQELYSWEIDNDLPVHKLEGHLSSQINKSVALYVTNLQYLIDVCNYSMVDKAKRLAKYIQTEEDINASTTIAANKVVQHLQADEQFLFFCKKENVKHYVSEDVVKNLFTDMTSKPKYKEYAALQQPTLEQDKEIISFIIKKVFQSNKDLEHHLEELFINYDDDNALLLHILGKYIDAFSPDKANNFFQSMEMWDDEKKYAIDLLRKTIDHSQELNEYIEPNLKNWEMDRVAVLDMILMKMAVCELKYFPTIPVKVTINEYIDISKLYSTPRSKDFVNGVIDKVKNTMKQNNEIKKFGRGLME